MCGHFHRRISTECGAAHSGREVAWLFEWPDERRWHLTPEKQTYTNYHVITFHYQISILFMPEYSAYKGNCSSESLSVRTEQNGFAVMIYPQIDSIYLYSFYAKKKKQKKNYSIFRIELFFSKTYILFSY